MMILFSTILFIVTFSSIIVSLYAIFQILNNDFNGSKGSWIIISMIGFIGPILYLTKGRKLIVKRDYQNVSKLPLKNYYIQLVKNLNNQTKVLFIVSISLILLGKIIRYLDIYVFWESEHIGYTLLLISIIIFFVNDIKERKKMSFKPSWCYLGIFVASTILFAKLMFVIAFSNSDAYEAAKFYLKNDSKLLNEIGNIQSFNVLPTGNLSIINNSGVTHGEATITLIVKGAKKFKEKTLYLEKSPSQNWKVILSE
jgi:hypothetical protein